MKIVTIDALPLHPDHVKELRSLGTFVQFDTVPINETDAMKRVEDADVIINFWYKMPASMFELLPKLKMVCVGAVGYEWIDTNAAKKHNVIVCNCPGHNGEAVAEHTIGLMLSAARFTGEANAQLHKGIWNSTQYKGKELKDKTLGIIGYGFIGQRVGEIAAQGLGMKVLHINSKSSRKEFETLLKQSDVVSINTALNASTNGMLSDKEFDLIKPGVILINTSRGAVINQEALIKNLQSRKIFAAGLDVFVNEPINDSNPLLSLPNVIGTPHIGWNTEESEFRLSKMVLDNIRSFVNGKPRNVVS